MIDRHDANRAAADPRPDQGDEPAGDVGPGAVLDDPVGRGDGEVAGFIHEHDADMAKMLELIRQFPLGLLDPVRALDAVHRGLDQAIGDLERGLHLDLRRGARVHNRKDAGHDRGKKVYRRDGD